MLEDQYAIKLEAPAGGWFHPWPNVFELTAVLPVGNWMLIGGLMVHAHAYSHGIDVIRPTDDLDILLNIELSGAIVSQANTGMVALEYILQEPLDARRKSSVHYRYARRKLGSTHRVDVMIADHLPSNKQQRLQGRPMFEVTGGSRALNRPLKFLMDNEEGSYIPLLMPDELGALILKSAAYTADRRDPERHLQDAAVLAACITDHEVLIEELRGSDRKRLRKLANVLDDSRHPAWLLLTPEHRLAGQDTLRILTS
jgi:hypothetical protein